MSNNAQKTPMGRSFNQFTERKILDALQVTGRALPCSVVSVDGAIITVQFEVTGPFTLPQVSIPLFGPEYVRYPIQPGDQGVAFAADARLGGVSGLSAGVTDLAQPANLGSLVFFPIGNATWGAVDPQSVTIYGPNGVVLRDTGSHTVMTLTPSGISVICATSFTLSVGPCAFSMNSSGVYSITGTTGSMSAATLGLSGTTLGLSGTTVSMSGTTVGVSGTTVSLTDASHTTGPTTMHDAWNALISWLSTHQHYYSGSGPTTGYPTTSFTGGNIAP